MARYTLEPGRTTARDGVKLAHIQRREIPEAEHPHGAKGAHALSGPEADNLARAIVAALNAMEGEPNG